MFKALRFLYIQANPITSIASQILTNSQSIQAVRSDWYMLCCVLNHVEDCEPQGQLVSSCESLLSFITAKVFITIQAVFALFVNGAVVVSFLFVKFRRPDLALMISLELADSMMGVYLFILIVMDLATTGSFHLYISQWTQSYVCLVAGSLNFLLSQTSLCILVTLSVVRAVAIQKVGGLKALRKMIVSACVCIWGFVLALVIFYITTFELGKIRMRNNMCIILGLS